MKTNMSEAKGHVEKSISGAKVQGKEIRVSERILFRSLASLFIHQRSYLFKHALIQADLLCASRICLKEKEEDSPPHSAHRTPQRSVRYYRLWRTKELALRRLHSERRNFAPCPCAMCTEDRNSKR